MDKKKQFEISDIMKTILNIISDEVKYNGGSFLGYTYNGYQQKAINRKAKKIPNINK